jgi:hypothetical protein
MVLDNPAYMYTVYDHMWVISLPKIPCIYSVFVWFWPTLRLGWVIHCVWDGSYPAYGMGHTLRMGWANTAYGMGHMYTVYDHMWVISLPKIPCIYSVFVWFWPAVVTFVVPLPPSPTTCPLLSTYSKKQKSNIASTAYIA